ncbi:MAG: phage portal protein [Ekhidna sp.]|nr:phage portal protein [Ekhidna sp.]
MNLPFFRKEKRGEVPAGSVPQSASNFLEIISGMSAGASSTGITVTVDKALAVPAFGAAVNFLSGTLAGLPLHVYKRKGDSKEKVKGGIATILHDVVNDEMSSFDWRKYSFERVFTGGRSFTFIERNAAGKVMNLFPLDPSGVTVQLNGWEKTYKYKDGGGQTHTYLAKEIIDIPWMLKNDRVNHYGPVTLNKDALGLAIAATEFGSKFFQNGGVPPFVVTGGFKSGGAMDRASQDLGDAIKKAAKEERQALVLPEGLSIESIGSDAEKSQLVELKRFSIEEIARIFSLPPTFLQDLTNGTFSNTEQQDLHFVKHTLKRWVEQVEQELNLKLFGRNNNRQFVEFSMDGMLRGDFATRMQGYATAIQNGVSTPNEVRQKENMPEKPNGDELLIQGATVPLGSQPVQGELNLVEENVEENNRQIVKLLESIDRSVN